MTTNPLDLIEARAQLAQEAWEAYQRGGSEVRMISRANDSAEDVTPLVRALRAVETVENDLDHPDYCGIEFNQPCTCWHAQILTTIREALNG